MSLSGVKRTCRFALHMSAFDPKRTLALKPVTQTWVSPRSRIHTLPGGLVVVVTHCCLSRPCEKTSLSIMVVGTATNCTPIRIAITQTPMSGVIGTVPHHWRSDENLATLQNLCRCNFDLRASDGDEFPQIIQVQSRPEWRCEFHRSRAAESGPRDQSEHKRTGRR